MNARMFRYLCMYHSRLEIDSLNVIHVAVLPAACVLTSSLDLDPILTNTVSISPSLDHPIRATTSRQTHSY
jgi:hypothetical protein